MHHHTLRWPGAAGAGHHGAVYSEDLSGNKETADIYCAGEEIERWKKKIGGDVGVHGHSLAVFFSHCWLSLQRPICLCPMMGMTGIT